MRWVEESELKQGRSCGKAKRLVWAIRSGGPSGPAPIRFEEFQLPGDRGVARASEHQRAWRVVRIADMRAIQPSRSNARNVGGGHATEAA